MDILRLYSFMAASQIPAYGQRSRGSRAAIGSDVAFGCFITGTGQLAG